MITLGITGGVGAGKSMILKYINEKYNVKLIYCDELARHGITEDKEIIKRLKSIDGKIYDAQGELNRESLADIIFNDRDKLRAVNDIVHPYVKNAVKREMTDSCNLKSYDGLIVEAALLLEEEYDSLFDCIYVYAKISSRKKRLKIHRGYDSQRIDAIINTQLDEAVFRKRCRYTIDNDGDAEIACRQIDDILESGYGLRRKDV